MQKKRRKFGEKSGESLIIDHIRTLPSLLMSLNQEGRYILAFKFTNKIVAKIPTPPPVGLF